MISKKQKLIFSLLLSIICCSFLLRHSANTGHDITGYYLKDINKSRQRLLLLKASCEKKQNAQVLQHNFREARLAYKQLAVLTEYFFPVESRLLNGPPIDRVEEDYPTTIIHPHGFQVVESYLFGKAPNRFYCQTADEISEMLRTLTILETKKGLGLFFNEPLVWDALRSSLVRITTLAITGYDSPVALFSIEEANASLKAVQDILSIFEQAADVDTKSHYNIAFSLLGKTSDYLNANKNFNEFNRLDFISRFINPLYKSLVELRISNGISAPAGNYAVNFNAASIFSDTALNINFYSPGGDYIVTNERVELGRKLFYDPVLSGTKNRSCASCHKPELAFTDGLKIARAIDQKSFLSRNTPTLLNAGFQSHLFYDSRTDILENQLDEVVHNDREMKGSFAKSTTELKNNDPYNRLFRTAYAKEKEPVSAFNIANAIASYIRSLNTLNSRFDRYIRGEHETLSGDEKNGFNLFMGKAKCATCHHPPLFNGLLPPDFMETESEVIGVPSTTDTIRAKPDGDLGKFLFTRSPVHKYSFKTPTLRNIELTAPYMHNGVYKTLEEVLDFYNKGGGKGLKIAPTNQTLPFDRLILSKEEEEQIIKFLKTLTDTSYLHRMN